MTQASGKRVIHGLLGNRRAMEQGVEQSKSAGWRRAALECSTKRKRGKQAVFSFPFALLDCLRCAVGSAARFLRLNSWSRGFQSLCRN